MHPHDAPASNEKYSKVLNRLLESLETVVDRDRISVSRGDLDEHDHDQSSNAPHKPDAVVWPESTDEVSRILSLANEARLPVTPWGAGTSLEGNPIPVFGGLVMDFAKMNAVVDVHATDMQVTVQPGVHYKDLNETLAREGLFFAPDPGANATIGGMIANNAAGLRTVKYGATKDNVLRLEAVLASGEIVRTGSRSVKQSSGYDLTHLFIGSEGTLGVITEATLKLAPLPEHVCAVIAAFPDVEKAAQAVFEVMAYGLDPSALELLDTTGIRLLNTDEHLDLDESPHLFMEFTGPTRASLDERLKLAENICRDNACTHHHSAVDRAERDRLWEARHRFFEILVRNYPGHNHIIADVGVPISNLPELVHRSQALLEELDIPGQIMGHAGDGNLHVTLFYPPDDDAARELAMQMNARLVKEALALGGTSTGEHGVGLGKQKHMLSEHGETTLNLMRQLKTLLDPNNILNPGKVLPPQN